ncbi:MAG: TRAP transporter small permease [Deltaproteobacteria bacterium]|nr:TRAP transporter small permease [Deltaproteobacteria bacterium]MBF0526263.1 TRAP transporter small permease [Deltaproteobacteria bacterium]
MTGFSNLVRLTARLCYTLSGCALAGIVLLTVTDVLLRMLKHPIVGTYELVGLLSAVVIGMSIPQSTLDHGHVLMDFLTNRFPPGLKIFLEVFTRLLGMILFLVISWNLWCFGDDLRTAGEVSLTLQIPQFPVAYCIAVSSLIQSLVLLVLALEKRKKRFSHE